MDAPDLFRCTFRQVLQEKSEGYMRFIFTLYFSANKMTGTLPANRDIRTPAVSRRSGEVGFFPAEG